VPVHGLPQHREGDRRRREGDGLKGAAALDRRRRKSE
jgi:hypothetical protein